MCDFAEKEKIGLISIRVKLTIRVRLKLGQTFAFGLTLINKRLFLPSSFSLPLHVYAYAHHHQQPLKCNV